MQLIEHYFPSLTPAQREQFRKMASAYQEWNQKINVISRKDMDNFYERHVLHSLAIAKFMEWKKGTKILDVGTGGGFPGVPLAVIFPHCQFHLVDSIGKKIKVVEEVCHALDITNVSTEHNRVENIKTKFDFVVSRAVTELATMYQWVQPLISSEAKHEIQNGLLYLKGGDIEAELQAVKAKTNVVSLTDYFTEPFFETKKIVHVFKA